MEAARAQPSSSNSTPRYQHSPRKQTWGRSRKSNPDRPQQNSQQVNQQGPQQNPQQILQRGLQNNFQRSPQQNSRRAPQQTAEQSPQSPQRNVDSNNLCKVHVTGYPKYTQSQDLMRLFKAYGSVQVETMNQKFAVLCFATKEDASSVIQMSGKVNIYAHFLMVKPYTGKQTDTNQQPRRNFTRTKQKGTIIDPKEINLTGSFQQQVDNIMAAIQLTREDVLALNTLYEDLENVLQELWPDCSAQPFGSISSGLGIKTSDADCFMKMPDIVRQHNSGDMFVNKTKRLLQKYPQTFTEIISIPRANTPIVKFFHIPTKTNCDVSFKTLLGVQNSKLIGRLLHTDERLIPLAVLIKYWAKVHDLSGTGRLTNYALVMMVIYYLQLLPLPILPSVESLQRDTANEIIVDHWNTGISDTIPPTTNTSTLFELFGGFFEFYSKFDFATKVVCPYLGDTITKNDFKNIHTLPRQFDRYKTNIIQNNVPPFKFTTSMCVQDPYELCHNVACGISSRLSVEIIAYIKFAAEAYEKEKPNGSEGFLKTILLQKPNLPAPKGRGRQEFKVHLYSTEQRQEQTENQDDWRAAVKKIVFTTFEEMLKINLEKLDDKEKKGRERYIGSLTRAVWKRKRFSKIYDMMKMDFEQREIKITEEILNVDKNAINVRFLLIIIHSRNSQNTKVVIKMVDGDSEIFRDFGRFYSSDIQKWMLRLIRPYWKSPETNDADSKTHVNESTSNLKSNPDTTGPSIDDDSDDEDDSSDSSDEESDDDVVNDAAAPLDGSDEATVKNN